MTDTQTRDALKERLYAALKHSKGCSCGECSGGLNAVDALVRRVETAERDLRREWWLNHGHDFARLYGDDGEMQCAGCADFKRDSIDRLRLIVQDARMERAALAAAQEPRDRKIPSIHHPAQQPPVESRPCRNPRGPGCEKAWPDRCCMDACEECDGTGCLCWRTRDWQSIDNGCHDGCHYCGRNDCPPAEGGDEEDPQHYSWCGTKIEEPCDCQKPGKS